MGIVQRVIDNVDLIAQTVTGRQESLFSEAMQQRETTLRRAFENKVVLLTGGAGFIATQTLKQILPFTPRAVVIADADENRLAELVRTVRSGGLVDPRTQLEPRLLDITTPMVHRLFTDIGTVDICLQFAAAKHVRTERDPVSLLRLLQVNLLGTMDFTAALQGHCPDAQLFVVSTDKAADPSSFMGASKRLMEMAILGTYPRATTTRFANVAFSTGSLLESWLIRLRLGQPLAVPADTWRFFVSPQEAGQLCALAATAPAGSVVVPDEQATGLVELQRALERVLATENLTAAQLRNEAALTEAAILDGFYPVVVTPRDTAGEKQAETFVGVGEHRDAWLPFLDTVRAVNQPEEANAFAAWLRGVIADPDGPLTLDSLGTAVSAALPEFTHVASSKRLDDRI